MMQKEVVYLVFVYCWLAKTYVHYDVSSIEGNCYDKIDQDRVKGRRVLGSEYGCEYDSDNDHKESRDSSSNSK